MWIDKLLGRAPEPTLREPLQTSHEDVFWSSLADGTLMCSCCDQPIRDLLSLAYPAPGIWVEEPAPQPNSEFSKDKAPILTDDFCAADGHLFVRAVMEFPLTGYDAPLLIGVWGTLTDENFDQFHQSFGTDTQGELPLMFSWLSNPVPAGEKVPEPCAMQPLPNGLRPRMMFADTANPWSVAQIDGLDAQQLCDFLAKFGHRVKEA